MMVMISKFLLFHKSFRKSFSNRLCLTRVPIALNFQRDFVSTRILSVASLWTANDDKLLADAVQLSNKQLQNPIDWKMVSDHVGNGQSPIQCEYRWKRHVKYSHKGINSGPWSNEEDAVLLQTVSECEGVRKKWILASANLNYLRTPGQCINRWSAIKPQNVKRGKWTPDEIELLHETVAKYFKAGHTSQETSAPTDHRGSTDWIMVSAHFNGSRTPAQCATKWYGYSAQHGVSVDEQSRSIVTLKWTRAEDRAIEEGVEIYEGKGRGGGVCWDEVKCHVEKVVLQMSSKSSGTRIPRTAIDCRQRWYFVLKPRKRDSGQWTAAADSKLFNAIQKSQSAGGTIFWGKVSAALAKAKSAEQCRQRWEEHGEEVITSATSLSQQFKRRQWSTAEDDALAEAIQLGFNECGRIRWSNVAESMEVWGRSETQCELRWKSHLRFLNLVCQEESHWSSNEDDSLAELVYYYRSRSNLPWKAISEELVQGKGRKSAMACFLRWSNILRYAPKYEHYSSASGSENKGAEGGSRSSNNIVSEAGARNGESLPVGSIAEDMLAVDDGLVRRRVTGRWSVEEDMILLDTCNRLRESGQVITFDAVSFEGFRGTRDDMQCRIRYNTLQLNERRKVQGSQNAKRTVAIKKRNRNRVTDRDLFIFKEPSDT